MSSCANAVQVSREPFGSTQSGQDVFKFKLTNQQGVHVELINYGAAIVSLHVPDKNGILEDVVLGFDDIDGNYDRFPSKLAVIYLQLQLSSYDMI